MFLSRLLTVLLCAAPIAPLAAHEFWIEPDAYQVSLGDSIQADLKNGENFAGARLSYLERDTVRHEMAIAGAVQPIVSRSGDRPAVQMTGPAVEGLLVLVHETDASRITYKTWEKFMKFVNHKDFRTAEADHIAAGWPQEDFRESYSRHVKTLIGVGNGLGADRAFGMATEFVALSNPYDPAFDGTMQVVLSYQSAPRPDAQIEVFERGPDGEVVVSLHRTDAKGNASIPVKAGHAYLFDAVVLRKAPDPGDDPKAPVWETLWAGLTFAVPSN